MFLLNRWSFRKCNHRLNTLIIFGILLALLFWCYTSPEQIEVVGWEEGVDRDTSHYTAGVTVGLGPKTACAPRLQVVVPSAPHHTLHRAALRNTWARPTPQVSVAFLLGQASSAQLQEEIESESRHYGDIIQMSFVDSYNNLTLKSVLMLQWFITTCPDTAYLLKADDDVIANLTNLLVLADSFAGEDFLTGRIFCRVFPIIDVRSKWYCPRYMYREDIYPNFVSGPGYVMNRRVAEKLYQMALLTPIFHLEDVYLTGIVASRAEVRRVGAVGIWTSKVKLGCHPEFVLVHSYTPAEIETNWHDRHSCSFTVLTIEELGRLEFWCEKWNWSDWGGICPSKKGLTYVC